MGQESINMTKAQLEAELKKAHQRNVELNSELHALNSVGETAVSENYRAARLRLERETGELHTYHEMRRKEVREKFVAHIMSAGYSTFSDALRSLPSGANVISILNDLGDKVFYCFFEDDL